MAHEGVDLISCLGVDGLGRTDKPRNLRMDEVGGRNGEDGQSVKNRQI